MAEQQSRVEHIVRTLDADAQQQEHALDAYARQLLQARAEIDHLLRRARLAIEALRGNVPLPDAGDLSGPVIRRMGRREAEQRRGEAGESIYAHMSAQPRGTQFSAGELMEQFASEIHFMLPKILDQWNAAHPTQQIRHNGLPRAERRYHL